MVGWRATKEKGESVTMGVELWRLKPEGKMDGGWRREGGREGGREGRREGNLPVGKIEGGGVSADDEANKHPPGPGKSHEACLLRKRGGKERDKGKEGKTRGP